MKKNKWIVLASTLLGGATLFHSGGCSLDGFWAGMFQRGWPSNNRWLNLGIDILNEELFG